MNLDVAANPQREARSGIDPIDVRLDSAPHSHPGGQAAEYRLGQGEAAVSEQVAAVDSDHPGLGIAVEHEAPRPRLVVDPGLGEQGERTAPAAVAADRLAPFGRQPQWNRSDRPVADAAGDLAAALTDIGTGAEHHREARRDVVE